MVAHVGNPSSAEVKAEKMAFNLRPNWIITGVPVSKVWCMDRIKYYSVLEENMILQCVAVWMTYKGYCIRLHETLTNGKML